MTEVLTQNTGAASIAEPWSAGASGYAPGDQGYIDPANGSTQYQIDTVDGGGAVLTYHLVGAGPTLGSGYAVASNVATQTSSGVGTGFTMDITQVALGDGTLELVITYITQAL